MSSTDYDLSFEEQVPYIQPHYKESHRLAIYALLCGGREAYEEFLRVEQISHFLSEEEIRFILENAELPVEGDDSGCTRESYPTIASTYSPKHSDVEMPKLYLGWPETRLGDTQISMLSQPPYENSPTIKEVVRKQITVAREAIAIVMDVFTDADIFKELVNAALRGVAVYILLDESQFASFLNMSLKMGINIQHLRHLCVRTIQGEQYQSRSAIKFHGRLENKFIIIDCNTVLYGTYSYTWSYEKIHLSMILVITGQLVSVYNKEFKSLYARSVIPTALSSGSLVSTFPKSSQLSLNIDMKPGSYRRGAMNERFNNAAMLNRGCSVQELMHHSDFTDTDYLMKGSRYGGDQQKFNSVTRLKMGTRKLGVPVASGKTDGTLRQGRNVQQPNRGSQQHARHQSRHGTDDNLISFNSETSLNNWRINSYLRDNNVSPDESFDTQSLLICPPTSPTGLNDYQSQQIQRMPMDTGFNMEQNRQKRLSLREYANPRQSQESLRSSYSTAETQQHISGFHGRSRVSKMDSHARNVSKLKEGAINKEAGKTEKTLSDGQRFVSYKNTKQSAYQKTVPAQNMHNPASTQSDAELDLQLRFSTGILTQPRVTESLSKIPEEKEATNARGNSVQTALGDKMEIKLEDKKVPPRHVKKSSLIIEAKSHDKAGESHSSIQNRIDSPSPVDENKSIQKPLAESSPSMEPHRGPTTKEHTQQGESVQQRKALKRSIGNSVSRKERSLLKSQNNSDLTQAPETDMFKTTSLGRLNKKYASTEISPQQSSKKKTTPSADQDQSTLDNEAAHSSQSKTVQGDSHQKSLNTNENVHLEKPERLARNLHQVKSSSLPRKAEDSLRHLTQGSAENKLGRLMHRMGHVMKKNK